MVLKRISANPLYAYMDKSPITAANPLRPSQSEIDKSRELILYNQESYEEFLEAIGEPIKPTGTLARATQCSSIGPS